MGRSDRDGRTRPPLAAVRLPDFIRSRGGEIIRAWEAAVRKLPIANELSRPALIDHIPELLGRIAEIADELAAGGTPTLPRSVAEVHAIERLAEGFDLSQVVVEFAILRDCISQLWEASELVPAQALDVRVLNAAIDKAVTASVERYTVARDRTIQTLDRIATAALESRGLDDLLGRLLRVLVETTASVDTAAIMLRDGDVLVLRAAVGLEAPLANGFSLRIGEGFAGTIAAEGRARSTRSAVTDPLVQHPALRGAGIQALHGEPLIDGEQVIGVAIMGSATATEFSHQDQRLLAALASRATAAMFQHVLRERAERAAAELREREQQFRTLADNIPQLAWMADETGAVFWYNRRWFDYTGTTLERVQGWQAVHHPDHIDRVTAKYRQAIARGEIWEDLFPLRGRDGRYRWFLSRAIPIRDGAGAVYRWFGTNTDVTDQRFLAEATALLSSSLGHDETLEQLARLAVPELADWCIVDLVEEDGTLRRVAIEHTDPGKLALARAWANKHPPDARTPTGIGAVLETGEPVLVPEITDAHLVQRFPDPDDLRVARELGLCSYLCVPLVAGGRILGTITLITACDRHYDSEALEVARELGRRAGTAVDHARLFRRTQDSVRQRDDILAIVSHDLRNPLGAIDLAASMLADALEDPRTRKHLDIIRRSARRMEVMIRDLLDMASLQAGRLALDRHPEDAAQLVAEVLDSHAPLAAEKHLTIERPCDLSGVTMICDRGRIIQVLSNLIGNAIKFCRPGDRISLRCDADPTHVWLIVEDTGPGIDPAELPRLFEAYWSAKRHAAKGSGLGLYIAEGIIDAHGGTITVDSTPGVGSRFTVTLPRAT